LAGGAINIDRSWFRPGLGIVAFIRHARDALWRRSFGYSESLPSARIRSAEGDRSGGRLIGNEHREALRAKPLPAGLVEPGRSEDLGARAGSVVEEGADVPVVFDRVERHGSSLVTKPGADRRGVT
jgi:hypothetical protein